MSDQCWLLWMLSAYRAGCLGLVCRPCSGRTFSSGAPSPKPSSQALVKEPPQSPSRPGFHWILKKRPGTKTDSSKFKHNCSNKYSRVVCKHNEGADACLWTNLVHYMTKLMEVSLHFIVLEKRGPSFSGFGEVSHHSCHWNPAFSIRSSAARLESKAGCVAVLSFPGGR